MSTIATLAPANQTDCGHGSGQVIALHDGTLLVDGGYGEEGVHVLSRDPEDGELLRSFCTRELPLAQGGEETISGGRVPFEFENMTLAVCALPRGRAGPALPSPPLYPAPMTMSILRCTLWMRPATPSRC